MAGQDTNLRPRDRRTGGCKRWEGVGRPHWPTASLGTGWLSQHFLGYSEYVLICESGDQVPYTGDSMSPSLYRQTSRQG